MSTGDDPRLDQSLHRWQVAGVVVFLLLVAVFPLYRIAEAGGRADTTTVRRTTLVTVGEQVWADNCALCHGDNGEGVDSPALNSRQFQEVATNEQIVGLARVGIPGTNMQAWSDELGGPLTDEQISAVAAFIKSWKEGAPDVPDWRTKFLGTPPPMPTGHTHGAVTTGMDGMDMTQGGG